GVPFEFVNVSIALIIFFVGINFLIRFVMAKVIQGKKQEEIVATIESKPTNQNHEGGEL
ncbi:ABC transporter permease, partial [Enterococcus faecium]